MISHTKPADMTMYDFAMVFPIAYFLSSVFYANNLSLVDEFAHRSYTPRRPSACEDAVAFMGEHPRTPLLPAFFAQSNHSRPRNELHAPALFREPRCEACSYSTCIEENLLNVTVFSLKGGAHT